MKRVTASHILSLDIQTDKSHLFDLEDISETPLLTFDSNAVCTNAQGDIICRLRTDKGNNWICINSLNIVTTPVSMNKREGIFDVEAEFCKKWLDVQKHAL